MNRNKINQSLISIRDKLFKFLQLKKVIKANLAPW